MKYIIVLIAIVVIAVALVPFTIGTNYIYYDTNTGNQWKYTQWRFTGVRSHESFVEGEFAKRLMTTPGYSPLPANWVSSGSTGFTIYGQNISFSHGRPGAVMRLKYLATDGWIASAPNEEILALYTLLLANDQEQITAFIEERLFADP